MATLMYETDITKHFTCKNNMKKVRLTCVQQDDRIATRSRIQNEDLIATKDFVAQISVFRNNLQQKKKLCFLLGLREAATRLAALVLFCHPRILSIYLLYFVKVFLSFVVVSVQYLSVLICPILTSYVLISYKLLFHMQKP